MTPSLRQGRKSTGTTPSQTAGRPNGPGTRTGKKCLTKSRTCGTMHIQSNASRTAGRDGYHQYSDWTRADGEPPNGKGWEAPAKCPG